MSYSQSPQTINENTRDSTKEKTLSQSPNKDNAETIKDFSINVESDKDIEERQLFHKVSF